MREILKAGAKTGGGSMASLLLGGMSTKILAVVLGPQGVGLFSLLRQIHQTLVLLGTLGGSKALVQGLCCREGSERESYLVTAFWLTVFGALLSSALLMLLAPTIVGAAFGKLDDQMIGLVRWLALPVLLGVVLSFLNSLLNGFRAIGMMALAQIAAMMAGLLVSYPVSVYVKMGYPVALIGMLSAISAVGGLCLFIRAYRAGWLDPLFQQQRSGFRSEAAKHFFSIGGTTLITGFTGIGTLLAVRSMIVHWEGGLSGAGIFDVAWTLSMMYVTLILSSFGTYYLPTLAGISDAESRNRLITQLMRLTIPIMVFLVISVVVLKPLVVKVLYSQEFSSTIKIMRWMLIGDYIKATSWVLGMPILAYPNMKVFFWTETLWNIGFLVLSTVAIRYAGSLEGIGIAFLFLYVLHLAFFFRHMRSCYQVIFDRGLVLSWFLGLGLICMASWLTWSDLTTNWVKALPMIIAGICFSWFAISRNERTRLIQSTLRLRKLL